MSGRHQNTTLRALDEELLEALCSVQDDLAQLTLKLARVSLDPEGNAKHCEEVWADQKTGFLPEYIQADLLRRFLPSDPERWAPLLAASIVNRDPAWGEEFARETFLQLATRTERYSMPDAYGILLYASPAYAARFGFVPPALVSADALCAAFGGEPNPAEPDLRVALRDAKLSPAEVGDISRRLVVPDALPPFTGRLPHGVEAFDVDPVHLLRLVKDAKEFYEEASGAGCPVHVLWHANS